RSLVMQDVSFEGMEALGEGQHHLAFKGETGRHKGASKDVSRLEDLAVRAVSQHVNLHWIHHLAHGMSFSFSLLVLTQEQMDHQRRQHNSCLIIWYCCPNLSSARCATDYSSIRSSAPS